MREKKSRQMIGKIIILLLCCGLLVNAASEDSTDDAANGWISEETKEELAPEIEMSEEAAEGYIRQHMRGLSAIRSALKNQGTGLTGANRILYDGLKEKTAAAAAGEESSTSFLIPMERAFQRTAFSAEDLGVKMVAEDGIATFEATQALFRLLNLESGLVPQAVMNALMADCPYELYWYDKTAGYSRNWSVQMSADYSGNMIRLTAVRYRIRMAVSEDYALVSEREESGKCYFIDPVYGRGVTAAAENARQILQKYEGLSNYERLWNYKTEIRRLSEYNTEAASDGDVAYGNPWQIIWVFDGNPETKVVCEGYAKAFQYLNDLSDGSAEVISVQGLLGSVKHMWNVVRMENGRNYIADITNCENGRLYSKEDLFLTGCLGGSIREGYVYRHLDSQFRYIYEEGSGFGSDELWLFPFDYLETGVPVTDIQTSTEIGVAGYRMVGKIDETLAELAQSVTITGFAVQQDGTERKTVYNTIIETVFFTLPMTEGKWHFRAAAELENGCMIDICDEFDLTVIGNEQVLEIPTGTKQIEDEAFRSIPASIIRIPGSVRYIGRYAFADNRDLILVLMENETETDETSFEGYGNIVRIANEAEYNDLFEKGIHFISEECVK